MAQAFRNMARATLIAATLFAASSPGARGGPAETLTLANHYDVSGTTLDGSTYKGKVTIDILSSTSFAIKWSIGGETFEGYGMRRNDVLAATYMVGSKPGVIIYEVKGNSLNGIWSIKGTDGSGTEMLTPAD